jgi:hypothetical protein
MPWRSRPPWACRDLEKSAADRDPAPQSRHSDRIVAEHPDVRGLPVRRGPRRGGCQGLDDVVGEGIVVINDDYHGLKPLFRQFHGPAQPHGLVDGFFILFFRIGIGDDARAGLNPEIRTLEDEGADGDTKIHVA